ncbi:MAG: hypothetical protein HOP31_02690, partial [Ignavibacteria bacterium]|nr:hypothetical protein [Ignavibacteria bacterium]
MKNPKYKKMMLTVLFALFALWNYSFNTTENALQPAPPPGPNTPEGRFLIGSLSSMWDVNTQHYQEGRLNLTHLYTNTESPGLFPKDPSRHTPSANATGTTEYLYSPVNTAAIQSTLNNVHSHNGSRVFWQRPKIEWLVYGQSSIYKAFQDNLDLFFYAFNDVSGVPFPDWQ